MSKPDAYSAFVSNITLGSVLLVSMNTERVSRSAIADGNNESGGWEFSVLHEVTDDGLEMNVRVSSRAESSTMSVEIQHQLQYDFAEPVDELSQEVITRFMGESVIVTVAPYIRELVHTIGMRMQCDVPWLSIIGPQDLTAAG